MEKYYILSNKYNLQERKTKLRGKVYDVVFRVYTMEGKEMQKRLSGFANKTLAKEGYLAFVQECCEFVRQNPFKKKNADKDVPTVGELFRQYISSLGNQNKQSVIYLKTNEYDLYIKPFYEKTNIDKLTVEELYKWQDNLWNKQNEKTGEFFSYNYLSKIRTVFSGFLSWVKKRYGYENNLSKVEKPKRRQQKKEMKFWKREEFDRFLRVVDNDMYRTLFTFLFFTGRRKGEIFALHKSDVKADKITFNKSVNRRTYRAEKWEIDTTKAEKSCTLPVCLPVQKAIKTYTPPKEGDFYFGGEEPLPPTSVDRAFKRYTALAGLPQIRMHDLRHSFVSMLIHEKASVFTIAALISDNTEQIWKTYGHLYEEDKISVLSKII